MFNNEGECGTGAVVPWANRLWVITYGPHLPFGSSDKLYEITPDLQQIVREESVGGTPANRMIHRESNQLAIGPCLIDAEGKVRVIPPKLMPGRLTGNARHLTDPANKLYYATMEEGLYEVDVRSLEVKGLIVDGNKPKVGQTAETSPAKLESKLPGYHGKGLYTAQGRVVYANNGERSDAALRDPTIASGALAEWKGTGDWSLVRRNQFTEVTGPGGIFGNAKQSDPLWSVGWDAKSLLLMVLDEGEWHTFRLPKSSHSYDGAHGWNTEWPRIRDIGEPGKPDLLMTMHGMFWRFPIGFSAQNPVGIRPRSSYLKVVGDFCRWNNKLVLGCDDTAKSEFLNKRKLKGDLAGPGQSQSNLWFVQPELLDQLGPAIGRGAVWLNEEVAADQTSDPFLVAGFEHRSLILSHEAETEVNFAIEVRGPEKRHAAEGDWLAYREVKVAPKSNFRLSISADAKIEWMRVRSHSQAPKVTAVFQLSNPDRRPDTADEMFAEIAKPADKKLSGGLIYARGGNLRTLRFAATSTNGDVAKDLGCYDLDANLKLVRAGDPQGWDYAKKSYAIPKDVITVDNASVLNIDEQGRRWRLPKGDVAFDHAGPFGAERIDREVCTERDLLNVHGTFYELPAENAGGFAKVRPVTTHNRRVHDYCSYRGLLVMSGIAATETKNPHVITSDDGLCKLWVGVVDDLWKFGKPRGVGGPWRQTKVEAKQPSDPYLMTGYDQKRLTIEHDSPNSISMRLEVDYSGTGNWSTYETLEVAPGAVVKHAFPADFAAYWVRLVPSDSCTATAVFVYE
ncbi:hypothetical protein NA78x_004638 [Anatilimnocola sp. NA78]|uniref:hypothetical protein n=1 Tax=Anatilimnocola sp. NA78 TaxID=3415683 RepID=UPI003CE492FF